MKIILANPRGFCAGVNMAIDSLERALQLFGTPLYVYHEIVHNLHVVDRFRKRGVVFVDRIDDIPTRPSCSTALTASPRPFVPPPPERQPPRHRRHLPAGHQGPSRSDPIRHGKATRFC